MKNPTSNLPDFSAGGNRRRWRLGVWNLIFSWACDGFWNFSARAAFVYETPSELVTSGDLTEMVEPMRWCWTKSPATSALVTKTPMARSIGPRRAPREWMVPAPWPWAAFGETNRDAIAVTAVDLNQIRILSYRTD